jgi:hypothetical protein
LEYSDKVMLPPHPPKQSVSYFSLFIYISSIFSYLPPFPFLSQASKVTINGSRSVDVRGNKWLEKLCSCNIALAQRRRHNCYSRCNSVRAFLDVRDSGSKTGNSSVLRVLYIGLPLLSRPKLSIQKLYSASTRKILL